MFVCFGSCTLPLDGGECLYLQHKINMSLNEKYVLSILPSVNGKFSAGWEGMGRSRSLKFTFVSRQAMIFVQKWLSANKVLKGDTNMMIVFDGSAYTKVLTARTGKKGTTVAAPPSQCGHTMMSANVASESRIRSPFRPSLISKQGGNDACRPATAGPPRLCAGGGRSRPPLISALCVPDTEWTSELAQVRRRLDSLAALHRLRPQSSTAHSA